MAALGIRETPSNRSTGKCRWCNPLLFFFVVFNSEKQAGRGKKKKKKIKFQFIFFSSVAMTRNTPKLFHILQKKNKNPNFFFLSTVSQSQLTWFTMKNNYFITLHVSVEISTWSWNSPHNNNTHTQKIREQIERRRDVRDKRQNQIRNEISASKIP